MTTTKRKDKRPLCRCHVWGFPHRLSVTLCEPDEEFMARLYLSRRELWEAMVDRMDMDPYPEADDRRAEWISDRRADTEAINRELT